MKYPKLWNGPNAMGEALVRSLQRVRSPFIRSESGDVVAGKMGRLSEVKAGKEKYVVALWFVYPDAVPVTPPPYADYLVRNGVIFDTGQPTDLQDGYYLVSNNMYLGQESLIPPNRYDFYTIEDGLQSGYYTLFDDFIGPLRFTGGGHKKYRWAIISAKTLTVVGRGEYDQGVFIDGAPQGINSLCVVTKKLLVLNQRLSGGEVVGQSALHNLRSLSNGDVAVEIGFPFSVTTSRVVDAKHARGTLAAITQSTSGSESFSRIYTHKNGVWGFTDMQSLYSWKVSAAKNGFLVGGWAGDPDGHILEWYDRERVLIDKLALGNQPTFYGVALGERYAYAHTWADSDNWFSTGELVRVIPLVQTIDGWELGPVERKVSTGNIGPDGTAPTEGIYVAEGGVAYQDRKIFVLLTGGFNNGSEYTASGDVFVQVFSEDGSKFLKSVRLDEGSVANGVASNSFGSIAPME